MECFVCDKPGRERVVEGTHGKKVVTLCATCFDNVNKNNDVKITDHDDGTGHRLPDVPGKKL